MRIPIIVPDFHTGNEPLRLSSWFVDKGDFVLAGDLIVELLIPGVSFDIAAETGGRLVEVAVPVDSTIMAGSILGWLEDSTTPES